MAILLTGGAGFIGAHTAVELITEGYEVVIADNLSNSRADMIDRIGLILGTVPAFYTADITDGGTLDRLFKEKPIEAVIHFAGYKAVGESVEKPLKYYRNNIDATLTLLEAMQKHGIETFVFSSSATVYGDPLSVPIMETAPVGDCANPYGRTKYFIEQILTDTALAAKNMSVVLLRYFNPIGAHPSGLLGELPSGVPNNLMPYITQTAAGIRSRLNVYGTDYPTPDGTGVRDYIHVVDLAKGHAAALRYASGHKGLEVFNLGTGKGYSVLQVIEAFEKATGITIPYTIAPRRPGDIAVCYAGTEKAERILGWRTEKTLEQMCRDAWRWQQNIGRTVL